MDVNHCEREVCRRLFFDSTSCEDTPTNAKGCGRSGVQVEVHPEAQAETRRAAIWYDERQLGLGDRSLAAVTGTLAGIAATPRAYPVWVALQRPPMPVRRACVTGFPYLVAFEVHYGTVSVLAVAHAKRRPLYWSSRRAEPRDPV